MALLDLARELETPLRLLEAAHEVNVALRGESILDDLPKGGASASEVLAA